MTTPLERIGLSRRSVDRAGDTLRDWFLSGAPAGPDVTDASRVLGAYRQGFKSPMDAVLADLQQAVFACGHQPSAGRRLKRQTRIIAKLARFPTMSLSRMQDIAGCRAVLADIAAVEAVRDGLGKAALTVSRVVDYNAEPRASGYRAVHLIVIKDGTPVEVQLRTEGQQAWAMLVEDLDSAVGLQLKDDVGPSGVLRSLAVYAEDIARLDLGGRSDATDEVVRAARTELMRTIGSDG
jgi:putative GTP pyrophosphokinase